MYHCYACNENALYTFYKKDKALIDLFNRSDKQKEVFFKPLNSFELIDKIFNYYSNEWIEIIENTLYYKNITLSIHPYFIETNDIYTNVLFDYMKRYHKIWCCVDENHKVIWINTCKV